MGEAAEMMLNGTLCQVCGCLNDDLIPDEGNLLLQEPGHPIICGECEVN